MRRLICAVAVLLCCSNFGQLGAGEVDSRFPLFAYLTGSTARMVTYTPSELDPRQEANQGRLLTSSIRQDLEAVSPAFDGLILYGYHEACTPRIVALAAELKFRAVILGIWDPKSAKEIDGVAALARQFEKQLAIGVLVGNEGLTFKRYEQDDLRFGSVRLRQQLPATIPISTSEPLVGYQQEFVRSFGDFLAPNIHPVFDRRELSAAEAAAWAREQAAKLRQTAHKPLILKETGFPHAGQNAYSTASQREFWAAYLQPGLLIRSADTPDEWTFHGVAFEAFDLPWKSEESKLTIEKSWGLLSPQRVPYPAFEVWQSRK